jgi:histone H3/H4
MSDLLVIRSNNETSISAQHLALSQIPGQIVGPLIFSNPPAVVTVNPNVDLSAIPVNKHAPTFGPVRPPLALHPMPNSSKLEPSPLALHFPMTLGEMSEEAFHASVNELLKQFWVNEKAAVRALPGVGSTFLLSSQQPKTSASNKKKSGGSKKIGLDPVTLGAEGYGTSGVDLLTETDFKNHNDLPLARIKRIMKSDEDVRMISAEAPIVFAKACELFILELTIRSYCYSEFVKRRCFCKEDVLLAVRFTDVFDFLAGCML